MAYFPIVEEWTEKKIHFLLENEPFVKSYKEGYKDLSAGSHTTRFLLFYT